MKLVRFFFIVILAVSLGACEAVEYGSANASKADPLDPVAASRVNVLPKVLIIGDSISQGYHKTVVTRLQGKAQVQRIPGNGQWTGHGVQKIDDWLGDTQWDVIHFNWGLWDIYGWRYKDEDRSPKAYERRLDELVTRLKQTNAKLIWATTTPACPSPEVTMLKQFKTEVVISRDLELQYLDAANRVMHRHGVQINDLHALVLPRLSELSPKPNDVHYTRQGSELLGERVANVIMAVIDEGAGK
ncbi:MAG: SGNH/GDSL hydrolase family protein [Phycisphaeraceae bacterium]